MALAFSTACSPCNASGPGRPPYKLPIAVAAIPQYAMAQSGSFWATAINVLAAAGNEKVCSIASARSNSSWTAALQATRKCTLPKRLSAFDWALACEADIAKHKPSTRVQLAQVRGGFEYPPNPLIVRTPYCRFFC